MLRIVSAGLPRSSPSGCGGANDRPSQVSGVPRVSTLEHWESYWRGHADLDRTYSTGGRLAREILRDGPVEGRRVLEVGAGSGRDTLELARRRARVVLDYSPASLALVRRAGARAGARRSTWCRADALRDAVPRRHVRCVFHQGLLEHFRDPLPAAAPRTRAPSRAADRVIVDVPQTVHLYTVMKQALIAVDRWFAGWETQFTPAGSERLVRATGLSRCGARTVSGWCPVSAIASSARCSSAAPGWRCRSIPRDHAGGARCWEGMAEPASAARRIALYTCHVIGTVGEKR